MFICKYQWKSLSLPLCNFAISYNTTHFWVNVGRKCFFFKEIFLKCYNITLNSPLAFVSQFWFWSFASNGEMIRRHSMIIWSKKERKFQNSHLNYDNKLSFNKRYSEGGWVLLLLSFMFKKFNLFTQQLIWFKLLTSESRLKKFTNNQAIRRKEMLSKIFKCIPYLPL